MEPGTLRPLPQYCTQLPGSNGRVGVLLSGNWPKPPVDPIANLMQVSNLPQLALALFRSRHDGRCRILAARCSPFQSIESACCSCQLAKLQLDNPVDIMTVFIPLRRVQSCRTRQRAPPLLPASGQCPFARRQIASVQDFPKSYNRSSLSNAGTESASHPNVNNLDRPARLARPVDGACVHHADSSLVRLVSCPFKERS